MKRTFTILGYVFLVVLVLLAAGYGGLWVAGERLDKESKTFMDRAVPAIAANWDVEELRKRASEEFDADADYDDVAEYFDSLLRLGSFAAYHGSTGEATITLSAPVRVCHHC